jgi:hypothetical protein
MLSLTVAGLARDRGELNVIQTGADAALRETLPGQPGAAAQADGTDLERLSPWFLVGIVLLQLAWIGGLAYLVVRVLQ